MSPIATNLPSEVISALAEACGFRVVCDHAPDADEWTLSAGHGATHVQFVGTKQSVCAFLSGYAAMRIKAMQMLNDLDAAHKQVFLALQADL